MKSNTPAYGNLNKVFADRKEATIWVSDNMVVFDQLGMWYDTKITKQFVPTTGYGFVVVTRRNEVQTPYVLKAWAVFRPRALELSWEHIYSVQLYRMTLNYAIAWYNDTDRQWVHLTAHKR